MLILSPQQFKEQHEAAKEGLLNEFNHKLESLLNQHQHIDKYWMIGKVRFPPELGGQVGHVYLEACLEKPNVVTESFLYEVDNRKGIKTLLWVMHPGGKLSLPTIGKTLSVDSPKQKRKKKRA